MIVIDLSKQQAPDGNPKAIQHINFTGNLPQQATIFFIIDDAKETVLDFFTPNCENIPILFLF